MEQTLQHPVLIFPCRDIRIVSLLLCELAELVPDLDSFLEHPEVERIVLAPDGGRCRAGRFAVLVDCSSVLILLFDESSENGQVGKMVAVAMLECGFDLFGLFPLRS